MESQSVHPAAWQNLIAMVRPTNRTHTLILVLLGIRMLYGVLAALALPYAPVLLVVLGYLYRFFTYLVTALLIWRERRRLREYRMGKLALILFIAGPLFYTLVALLNMIPMNPLLAVFSVPVSIWLAVKLIQDRQVDWANPAGLDRWLLTGAGIGMIAGALVGLMISLQPEHLLNTQSILNIFIQPFIQISGAAIDEEPLFRGFLWIYLVQMGWKDKRIWFFQAFLFCSAHIYYIPAQNYYSLVASLIGGLVIGWVAWKARDIAPSMLAHGFFNSFAQLIGDLAAGR